MSILFIRIDDGLRTPPRPLCNAGDPGSIPGSGRSPGEGNGNPFQYSCLENPIDRGDWWATVHGVAKVVHNLAVKPPQWGKTQRRNTVPQEVHLRTPGRSQSGTM